MRGERFASLRPCRTYSGGSVLPELRELLALKH
jgi:hypothetical protein